MRLTCVYVALLLQLAQAVYSEKSARSASYNLTADFSYDPGTESCCLGKVHPKPKGSLHRCCGTNVYDTGKQACCRHVIHNKAPGTTCCGEHLYDVLEAMCCADDVYKVPRDQQFKLQGCCGNQLYNTDKELCCHDLGTGKVVKTMKKHKTDSCCGSEVFDSKTQMCCSKRIPPGNGRSVYEVLAIEGKRNKCCANGKTYDPESEVCCGSEVINKSLACCKDTKGYDESKQLCCVGPKGEVKTPVKASSNSDCCAGAIYNIDTHRCCGNDLIPYSDENLSCCGNDVVYDSRIETCTILSSGWVVTKKSDPAPDAMCGMTPYNRKTYKCCPTNNGRVVAKKKSKQADSCCGSTTYDYSEQICCSDGKEYRVFGKNVPTTDCCGLKRYNFITHVCCNGKLSEIKNGKRAECCEDAGPYDPAAEVCCTSYLPLAHGIIKKSAHAHCCGVKSYDTRSQLCCNNHIHPKKEDLACCLDKIYNINTHKCCDHSIVPRRNGDKSTCCYHTTTDQEDFGEYPWFH